jgi:uncharacterized protein YxjI
MSFDADVFTIQQLVKPMVNLYTISADGRPVAFVRQKRLAIKEDIRFFADDTETRELFRIKARSVMELGAKYDVTTPEGERIGVLEKDFGRSLLRSTWKIHDAAGTVVGETEEKSLLIALLRRAIDFVPYGDFVPIPFHFTIALDGAPVGELTRERAIRDVYTLELSADSERTLDRRLAVALAIALDALQSR